jgi:hypothetical protein
MAIRTGTRCARRTQEKVGFTLASRSALVPRSLSAMPPAMLSTWPMIGAPPPISRASAGSPTWMRGSLVSSK